MLVVVLVVGRKVHSVGPGDKERSSSFLFLVQHMERLLYSSRFLFNSFVEMHNTYFSTVLSNYYYYKFLQA